MRNIYEELYFILEGYTKEFSHNRFLKIQNVSIVSIISLFLEKLICYFSGNLMQDSSYILKIFRKTVLDNLIAKRSTSYAIAQ